MAAFLKLSLVAVCALLGFVVANQNPISSPGSGDVLTAGKPFLLEWSSTSNHSISLFLKKGKPENLRSVLTIITHLPNTGIVRWTPPTHVYSGYDYCIQILDDETGDINYSTHFAINGQEPPTTSGVVNSRSVEAEDNASTVDEDSSMESAESITDVNMEAAEEDDMEKAEMKEADMKEADMKEADMEDAEKQSSAPMASNSTIYMNSTYATNMTTNSTMNSTYASNITSPTLAASPSGASMQTVNSLIVLASMILGFFILV
ncbi:Ser-Thr-rich glycosyl-phosphatidyl-inositol-anchored membrane family-domain-containing protein [Dipodascopsis uninucleata]